MLDKSAFVGNRILTFLYVSAFKWLTCEYNITVSGCTKTDNLSYFSNRFVPRYYHVGNILFLL